MIPIILGALALVALSASSSSAKRVIREPEPPELSFLLQALLRRKFRRTFAQLPGDRQIEVDEWKTPGQTLIRRYRPLLTPCPWELQSAASGDGVEHFSISFSKELTRDPGLIPLVTIRPMTRRPINVPLDFERDAGSDLTRDSYFANRRRYLHADEGLVEWFIVRVRTKFGVEWVFEHPSLFAQMLRERPALATPSMPPPPPPRTAAAEADYAEVLDALSKQGAEASAAATKAEVATEKANEVKASLDKLRADMLELNKPRRKSVDSRSQAVTEQLRNLKKVNGDVKRARAVIETLDAFDKEARGSIEDALGQVADNAIEGLSNALQGDPKGGI